MPELPEVETVRRGLEPAMLGQVFARIEQNRPDLRFPLPQRFVERLTGRKVEALSRRAKYLIADLDDGQALIMHLGMSGRFVVEAPGTPPVEPGAYYNEIGRHLQHDHVVFHLGSGARVTYNDVRRFGFMDLVPRADLTASKHFAGMGIEPLGNELSGETLAKLFAGKFAPLKAALLDQRLVAGLGNIYVCEALFRAGLHPEAPAGSIATATGRPRPAAHELARIIREVLEEAILSGGSTLRDFAQTDGSLGYFQHRFKVYDREGQPCTAPGCVMAVKRLVQSGRSTFYCESCQPRAAKRG
ncbi:bifunctional DNA-formamidopyrimidine glycosylase/DNA-(apurinic or apyrimidinic site) lyase [Bosea sp. PAMC 26642]|uniref:bifunctional DNA-formamidopyrimidine glycosylase/DNA-(apurinic or apyrimidinic site) lyase n=1 Tax=Bosea sp. (strain PAMC 26642) TaxID=1792307 RepID=UPI0007701E27|nr:bifunctional DNA-formamidopyrimidine glycosylase/DNA-(apurinic or apyrimidinic site) lyase [Bosea sp. PAMC 26642]AMJ62364.1 5-hydroxymethyluracil DNA glycosylase [Bosea sp. PAMC 26642]